MIVMTRERSIDPIPDATQNLYPRHLLRPVLSAWGQEDCVKSRFFLYLRKATEPKDLFKTCPLPKTSYLLSKPFILTVYHLSHNDTFPCSFV